MVKNILDYLKDNRTDQEFDDNWTDGMRRELLAIEALSKYHNSKECFGYPEKVDKKELKGLDLTPGVKHNKPDYFYYFKPIGVPQYKILTYEIKTSGSGFWRQTVGIKIHTIQTMHSDRLNYPNGRLMIASQDSFAIMDVDKVVKYPIERDPHLGNKLTYQIPLKDFKFTNWIDSIVEW